MTTDALRPRVPFIGWPRHWNDRRHGFVWVVDRPGAIITQTHHVVADVGGITWLHDILDRIVASDFIDAHPGTVILHDWRSVQTIGPGVREAWVARSRRPNNPFRTLEASYVALKLQGFARMSVQTAALGIQLATGQPPIRLVGDPAEVLESYGIAAPAPGTFEKYFG